MYFYERSCNLHFYFQMKIMTPDLIQQPPFCFECCLHNAPSKLLPEMTTLFSDTVDGVEEITAKIENVRSGICTVTLLFDKDDQEMNVNELLFGVKENAVESGDTTCYGIQSFSFVLNFVHTVCAIFHNFLNR